MTTNNHAAMSRIEKRRDVLLDPKALPIPKDCPRVETIENLSTCLRAFSNKLFDFFNEGFKGTMGYSLEPSVAYPKEYVLNTILSQVSHDIGALQKAYQQRVDPVLAKRLQTADNLAHLALEPAVKQQILPVSTAITYFHKSPNVRVIPYAPVALIGIPFSALDENNNHDLLAIPHEVGHYVYRHGRVPPKRDRRLHTAFEHKIEQSFPANQRWVLQWLEEIFADIYGCLVATKAMTKSFEEVLVSHSGQQFVGNPGGHPIPAVRMYIYTTALEKYGYGTIANDFVEDWKEILESRGKPFEFSLGAPYTHVSFDEAKKAFCKTIDCFTDLTGLDSLRSDQRTEYPHWGLTDETSFDDFVGTYRGHNPTIPIPKLEIRDKKVSDSEEPVQNIYVNRPDKPDHSNRKLGDTNTWIDIINQDAKMEAPIPPVAWAAIFDSLNWTEEGPHTRS